MSDTMPLFRRAMCRLYGPLFSNGVCRLCDENPVEPCYRGWPEVCSECEVRCRRPLVTALLRQNLRREPTDDMVITIAELCATYCTPRRRLHFLHNVLLARGSCFHQFTFFSGGSMGNISVTEDVLCRIMSFLSVQDRGLLRIQSNLETRSVQEPSEPLQEPSEPSEPSALRFSDTI